LALLYLPYCLALSKLDIPKRYWREFILIFAGLLFGVMIIAYQKKNDAAICYYRAGREIAFSEKQIKDDLDVDVKAPECALGFLPLQSQGFLLGSVESSSDKKIIQAESYLKTSNTLDPDNPGSGFALGYLYELQQDFDNAKKQYKVAARNGSRLGQIRWAKLLLREDKKDSAALAINVLLRDPLSKDIEESNPNLSIAWNVALATARLRQNRPKEAHKQIGEIWGIITRAAQSKKGMKQDIKDQFPQNNQSARAFVSSINKQMKINGVTERLKISSEVIATIDCVRSGILLKEMKQLNPGNERNVKKFSQACLASDSKDLFQDDLRGQTTPTP
jgi:tetratricopeptide (TPR) repeat protein